MSNVNQKKKILISVANVKHGSKCAKSSNEITVSSKNAA